MIVMSALCRSYVCISGLYTLRKPTWVSWNGYKSKITGLCPAYNTTFKHCAFVRSQFCMLLSLTLTAETFAVWMRGSIMDVYIPSIDLSFALYLKKTTTYGWNRNKM